MRSIVLLYLVLAIHSKSVLCIPSGQKMSILRAPFFVCLVGTGKDNKRHTFGGVILDETLVLTTYDRVSSYSQIVVKAGSNNMDLFPAAYVVGRTQHNQHVALVGIDGITFEFCRTIQRAILPKSGIERFQTNTMFYAASFGSTNPDYPLKDERELHGRPYYVTYKGLDAESSKSAFLIGTFDHKTVQLTNGDMGAPLWDLDTGEVMGLIAGNYNSYGMVIKVGAHREWIDNTRIKMKNY